MQARPVVGGVFIKLLTDPAMWKKWSSRDKNPAANWALSKGTVPFSSNENWDSPPFAPLPVLTGSLEAPSRQTAASPACRTRTSGW
jgi:hypothetical protein